MKNLYSPNVDASTVDNLVSGTLIPCKVISGELEAGGGILLRGTLLTAEDDGTYTKYADGEINGVLLNDVDTDDDDERLSAAVACCGEFNQNKIDEVMGAETPAAAIVAARKQQLYIAPMEPAPEAY
ncbi:MAG: hypothetical protein LBS19_09330 [Clostridiales bacterium]|jgi:hypothetical protein|nr:hypothetical protein [Clostridiales bacterium]